MFGYPNCIGAIDGTMIEVRVPDEHRIDYWSRKHMTAVNLTAVCSAYKTYTYINVGHTARSNDAHIFASSSLARDIMARGTIPRQYHIIGDAAYGAHVNIVVPHKGDDLTLDQIYHDTKHSSTRMVVERSFSDIKNRWLRLQTLRNDLTFAKYIIATCCCLLNICVKFDDIAPREHEVGNGNYNLDFVDASTKRQAIVEHLRRQRVNAYN